MTEDQEWQGPTLAVPLPELYFKMELTCCSIGQSKIIIILLSLLSHIVGQTDPQTPRAPEWKLIPNDNETAVEGRNKTLYCLAFGR